ncbi:MAG: hypothetical protein HKO55_02360 [Gammaproteobacteria bacterium]|nr:hypothetical protein [Gammaproteobacteria bacterium]NNM20101.1 hypothetical protein [Gammaproteobacteria bacterium]
MKLHTLLAGLVLSIYSISAQALILDFQSVGFSDGTGGSYASIYQQDGFDIRTPQTDSMHFHMGQLAVGDPEGVLPGWLGFHNIIVDDVTVMNTVTLTRIDGGAFNFDSFDILGTEASMMWTSRQNRWHNGEITIMSSNGDVMVVPASTWQSNDPETPDQTFLVGWTNVTWVTFLQAPDSSFADGEITMMDNVIVTPAAADTDNDSVVDSNDNCTLVANNSQLDSDSDNIGNACDGDIDNDCDVDINDLAFYRVNFLQDGDLPTDNNGDGTTDLADLSILRTLFLAPVGPSGLPNACTTN